ncbi:unnamed protein product [Caretta caretta]
MLMTRMWGAGARGSARLSLAQPGARRCCTARRDRPLPRHGTAEAPPAAARVTAARHLPRPPERAGGQHGVVNICFGRNAGVEGPDCHPGEERAGDARLK